MTSQIKRRKEFQQLANPVDDFQLKTKHPRGKKIVFLMNGTTVPEYGWFFFLHFRNIYIYK